MPQLGDILVRLEKVTPEQIRAALQQQCDEVSEKKIGEILIEQGVISESALLEALAVEFGCDFVLSVEDRLLDPTLVENLPVEWARSNCVLPIRWKEGIGVLTGDPAAMSAVEDLSLLLRRELTPVLALPQEILKAIERCYYRKKDATQDLIRDLQTSEPTPVTAQKSSEDLLRIVDQAPVTQLVNAILLEALRARASDVHVEPFEESLNIRYRIDGRLYEQASPPKHLQAALVSRLKVMARLDIAERRLPQDGSARVRVGEREIDIRVSTIPVAEGERVVLRLLNRSSTLLPLTELGMPQQILDSFRNVITEPYGLVLVTGPTGSGKTTTLYAALREVDTAHMNVLTIEDPIEYQLSMVGQMQVLPKIGLTFAQGLRHILRQDPDVVLVGETRDLETAEIAVRAALTGHLVFTTLHTNDATSAVIRLMEMGIESYLVSSAIKASLAQRLVRTLCDGCKERGTATEQDAEACGVPAKQMAGKTIWRAQGCSQCLGGYRGRTGIYEFMVVVPELQDAIQAGLSVREFRRMSLQHGMRSLLDDAIVKLLGGVTSVPEVLRAVGQHAS